MESRVLFAAAFGAHKTGALHGPIPRPVATGQGTDPICIRRPVKMFMTSWLASLNCIRDVAAQRFRLFNSKLQNDPSKAKKSGKSLPSTTCGKMKARKFSSVPGTFWQSLPMFCSPSILERIGLNNWPRSCKSSQPHALIYRSNGNTRKLGNARPLAWLKHTETVRQQYAQSCLTRT